MVRYKFFYIITMSYNNRTYTNNRSFFYHETMSYRSININLSIMKKIISKLFRRNIKFHDIDREFTITKEVPQPIRNVNPKDQMRIIETLGKLPVGSSFPIRNELEYTVRKMAEKASAIDHFTHK